MFWDRPLEKFFLRVLDQIHSILCNSEISVILVEYGSFVDTAA